MQNAEFWLICYANLQLIVFVAPAEKSRNAELWLIATLSLWVLGQSPDISKKVRVIALFYGLVLRLY